MKNKQAIANIKKGKNIPYKHETITTLIAMAEKLDKIEQIVNEKHYSVKSLEYEIKEVLEKE